MKLLEGIRVLDISTVIAAPFAAGLMADFGAEVIKVEMPDGGDPFRRLGPYHEGQAMRFACMGRNKKSITCNNFYNFWKYLHKNYCFISINHILIYILLILSELFP